MLKYDKIRIDERVLGPYVDTYFDVFQVYGKIGNKVRAVAYDKEFHTRKQALKKFLCGREYA